jgi:phenylalanyl-tRNA synthetase beta chain
LFRALGEQFTDDEFSDLCFKFGIELDEIHAEDGSKDISGVPANKIMYKIEIPANRYDLLCLEGLSRALRIFRGRENLPDYKVSKPAKLERMVIKQSVLAIRGVVVCAVLRDVTFTQAGYDSFIDLQEKLHENICRKRTLVSIGTHDLDTIQGPFSYEALPPREIVFAPLNKNVAVNGEQLMLDLAADNHLKKYLHIIQHLPTYPVIYDAQRRVLSLPPIINGNHSKITLNTRNVFVEITATDRTKALTVLDTMVAMFSQYCAVPFQVEPVEIAHENSSEVHVYPNWGQWPTVTADAAKICKQVGIEQQPVADLIAMLRRMSLPACASPNSNTQLIVDVPPTRSDVIAACDVMEDVAIGYGFERLIASKTIPRTLTSGRQQPLNKLTDQLRHVLACASYDEVLTFGLVSRKDNFTSLNKVDDGSAAAIANVKTQDFQIARTTLLPGLLKTVQSNKSLPLPLRVFEISDVVLKDAAVDVGAVNKRMLCAVFADTSSGFENIHGLLDTIMTALEVPWKLRDESKKSRVKTHETHQGPALHYEVLPSEDNTYFPGKRGDVHLNDKKIGVFGILHPEVLKHFGLTFPCSALQIEIEHFVDY